MADYPLPCTWEQVVDSVDHRNTAVMLENRNDPDLGNIIWSSLNGSQIYDLVRPRTEVGTIRQNVYAVDPTGRRCLLIGEPQTSTGTVVFSVLDGTTQYVYSIPNGGSLVNLTTIDMSGGGGAEEVFTVHFAVVSGVLRADCYFSDITTAKNAGKIIKAEYDSYVGYMIYKDDTNAYFASMDTANGVIVAVLSLNSSDVAAQNVIFVKASVQSVTGSTASFTPADGCVYECGTLSTLVVGEAPATGEFTICFTSGSTATTVTIHNSIKFSDTFSCEANTRYEINVRNRYAVVGSWPTT